MEIVGYAWQELEYRLKCVARGAHFYSSQPRSAWQDTPLIVLCSFVTRSMLQRVVELCIRYSYNEQGELFELLTQESLREQS